MRTMLLFCLALLAAGSLTAQRALEGTVSYSYTLESADGNELGPEVQMVEGMLPEQMTMTYGKEGIVTRMTGGMLSQMMGHVVINAAEREVYMLQESQKLAYVMKSEDMEESASEGQVQEVEKLDESDNILGYTCQKYRLVLNQQGMELVQYVWVTDQLVLPDFDIPGLQQFNSALTGADQLPGFPLRTRVLLPGMNVAMVMTARELSFESVDPAVFQLPEGYTTKDFSELTKQLQMGGFGGNR